MARPQPFVRATPVFRRRTWSLSDRWLAHALLWPALLALALVFLYPLAYSFWISLNIYNIVLPARFVGLRNYLHILTDPQVWRSFGVSFTFAIISLTLQFFIGFGIALLLHRIVLFRGLIRTIVIIPLMLTPVVLGLNWRMMLNVDWGIINYFIRALGFPPVNFIVDPHWALPSLILVDVWQTTSFTILVLSAGLASLPDEPFEAARIDGASAWQQLINLTIPMLRPIILVILLFRTYELIRVYDIVYAVTSGGPGSLTETISFHIFNRMFLGYEVGYASAISYILFAISLTLCGIIIKVVGIGGAHD